MLRYLTVPVTAFQQNCSIVWCDETNKAAVIDPGGDLDTLLTEIRRLGLTLEQIWLTHAHIDHAGGAAELGEVLVHPVEAAALRRPFAGLALVTTGWDAALRADLVEAGIAVPDLLVRALPDEGFDPWSYRVRGVEPSGLLSDGQAIDLGDRLLRVVHLPGHTPGSIGLLEERTGLLFTGDALYDGGLIDTLPESDVGAYCATMRRLRALPVACVLPGHGDVFGRDRLLTLTAAYLRRRG